MTTVGFIGVGTIGQPMALNVARGGFDLRVYDANPAALPPLVAAGATASASVAAAAAERDVVITVLPEIALRLARPPRGRV